MKFKKISLFIMIFAAMFLLTGCGNDNKEKDNENKEVTNEESKQDNTAPVEGNLEDLMAKIYENIPEDQRPMMLMNVEIDEENVEYYLGTDDIEYEEALASESGVGSIAHSVVLVRVKDNADIKTIKANIKDSVNPRKWICVEAEKVVVENRGNLIILIMSSSDNVDKLLAGFNNL